ncbi:hypothetical protein CORC01_00700 [Colletotrichum orchidophilum]|uniref:Uncharacterized protein n=1 Tax=Colletotrichum orchidophilum TaxID=1209926 RepID=A0A1G4BR60_9PEZI|nr:uncharacterized protein CORC01_00700 [Colletotrichum orchidophilum]OHF03838.1 hypothetical protein CORC01_00700 [Colletotrichum orchidophilum]
MRSAAAIDRAEGATVLVFHKMVPQGSNTRARLARFAFPVPSLQQVTKSRTSLTGLQQALPVAPNVWTAEHTKLEPVGGRVRFANEFSANTFSALATGRNLTGNASPRLTATAANWYATG